MATRQDVADSPDTTVDKAPPPSLGDGVRMVRVVDGSDANWSHGVTPWHEPPGIWVAAEPSSIAPGDVLVVGSEERKILYAWGQPGGAAVFFEGAKLDPARWGAPATVGLKSAPAVETWISTVKPTVEVKEPPKDSGGGLFGGILGGITRPLTDAANALGNAASTVGNAVGSAASSAANVVGDVASTAATLTKDLVDVAQDSLIVQTFAAVVTGGLSLAAQEAASGGNGPLTSVAKDVASGDIIKKLPGAVLTGTGLPGLAADALRAAGSAARDVFGADSSVGKVGDAVDHGVQATQEAAREHPIESLEVAAGAAATALGLPIGPKLLADGINGIINPDEPQPESAAPLSSENTGIVPPLLGMPSLTPPTATSTTAKNVNLVTVAKLALGVSALVVIGVMALSGEDSTSSGSK